MNNTNSRKEYSFLREYYSSSKKFYVVSLPNWNTLNDRIRRWPKIVRSKIDHFIIIIHCKKSMKFVACISDVKCPCCD